MLSEQLADAVATAGAALVAVHARPRLPSTGVHWEDGGVVATGGKWRCWKGGEIDRWLQSDLEIYPGFGGGPLVDTAGRIHGVNSGGLSRALATTIPVSTVNRVMAQLLERGYVARGWIGAAMRPVQLDPTSRQRLKRDGGLLLLSLEPDAPASRAGRRHGRPLPGDDRDARRRSRAGRGGSS